jgi:hypothetical protein
MGTFTLQEKTGLYIRLLDHIIESLRAEGRHNRAAILRDVRNHLDEVTLQLQKLEQQEKEEFPS